MKAEEVFSLLLPEGILEYFEVTRVEKGNESHTIYLEEKNIPPNLENKEGLISKGFYEPIVIQDFPLRGKAFFLNVKRRRWTGKESGNIISRDWNIVAQGTRKTKEFALFLKGIHRHLTSKL